MTKTEKKIVLMKARCAPGDVRKFLLVNGKLTVSLRIVCRMTALNKLQAYKQYMQAIQGHSFDLRVFTL